MDFVQSTGYEGRSVVYKAPTAHPSLGMKYLVSKPKNGTTWTAQWIDSKGDCHDVGRYIHGKAHAERLCREHAERMLDRVSA